jgi:hypothetical protein
MTTRHCRLWTLHDIARLKRLIDDGYTYADIGQQLGRTSEAIRSKAANLDYRQMTHRQTLTSGMIQQTLGLVDDGAVLGWIKRGWLPARNVRPHGKQARYHVRKVDLYAFLQDERHWARWSPETIVNDGMRCWATEMRANKPRWLTTKEVAARYHVQIQTVIDWIRKGRLSGVQGAYYYAIHESALDDFVPPCMREQRPR